MRRPAPEMVCACRTKLARLYRTRVGDSLRTWSPSRGSNGTLEWSGPPKRRSQSPTYNNGSLTEALGRRQPSKMHDASQWAPTAPPEHGGFATSHSQ